MQDVRYAIRSLGKHPVFTLVAILTLTLGIGANTAIFSILYKTLLRPLPFPEADRLVFVWNTYPLAELTKASVSIPDYIDRKTQAPAAADATLFTMRNVNLAEGGRPEQLRALAVTPSFFTTLGRQPFLGRGFTEQEATPDADRFVILTYALWNSRFGADRALVGRDIRINGEPYRVVGVLPADFELPAREVALLLPFGFTPVQMSDEQRGFEFSSMIARLAPGATIEQLNQQMKVIVDRNIDRLPSRAAFMRASGFTGLAVGFREEMVGDVRAALYIVQGGVLLVLLIACVNVANLLLMRATGRYRELAIRTTLGAGRWRLARQMLTEAMVLSTAGAVAGLALGMIGMRALLAMSADQLPALVDTALEPAVLLFTVVLAVLTGFTFGLVPAVAVLRGNTASLLKDDSTRGSAGRRTGFTRAALVVAETALALMLLVGAGLLIKSFVRLQQVNPGFEAENVLTAQIALPPSRYDIVRYRAFWQRLIDSASTIPGVTAVGATTNLPFNGNVASGTYQIAGRTFPPGQSPHGRQEVVGGDYFRAMHIPLVAGRLFNDGDTPDAPAVCIIDEYLVKKYFADQDPIGQQIQRGRDTSYTIVGVVGTINSTDLAQPVEKERLYYPLTQQPQARHSGLALVVKTRLDPQTLVPQVRAAVEAIDPEQPLADVRTMDQWIARSLEGQRTPTVLLGIFGGVALVLSAIGIYGVLAFGVAQRVREFGIRQALGADQRSILTLVMTQGMMTTAVGVALGLLGATLLARFLQSLLFGVTTHDVSVYAGVTVLLVAVAMLACYVPARRATTVDPMVALRES